MHKHSIKHRPASVYPSIHHISSGVVTQFQGEPASALNKPGFRKIRNFHPISWKQYPWLWRNVTRTSSIPVCPDWSEQNCTVIGDTVKSSVLLDQVVKKIGLMFKTARFTFWQATLTLPCEVRQLHTLHCSLLHHMLAVVWELSKAELTSVETARLKTTPTNFGPRSENFYFSFIPVSL